MFAGDDCKERRKEGRKEGRQEGGETDETRVNLVMSHLYVKWEFRRL